jgi:hypothetical protein
MPRLPIDEAQLAQFCRTHHIRRLSPFGSTLKGTARPDSDVDLLVEFEPDQTPGLLGLAGMEIELSALLGGKRVDLRTPLDLSRYFRDEVVRTAEVQYAGGGSHPRPPHERRPNRRRSSSQGEAATIWTVTRCGSSPSCAPSRSSGRPRARSPPTRARRRRRFRGRPSFRCAIA